jgi:hypothetical protein
MRRVPTVFVSHRHHEQDDADHLRARLGGRWRVVSHPVTADAAEIWQSTCRRLIGESDAVVCIVGDRTAESPNIEWELERAGELGRPLFAMRARAAAAPALPRALATRGMTLLEPDELEARLRILVPERVG